ncbi:exopolyphosphatase [Oceanospirillum sp.]|uniref:exopolyphosphatase n=1 Tax=Oceanospirillum sp. TaxID=2021254 RepID=UPI003A8CD11F
MSDTDKPATAPSDTSYDNDLLAAIDLGSNSFHLMVARSVQEEIRTLERLGEKVQLAAGLDQKNNLTEDAQQRALSCLKRFAPFLTGIHPDNIRIVGTNALRAARNTPCFLNRAQKVLGHPLEIISGREEARLIYMGAAHSLATPQGRRLVADIGGGSTEFIIGEGFEPKALESLHMGCVAYSKRFFPDGQITTKRYQQAVLAAKNELLNIVKPFKKLGWQQTVGTSGTIKACAAVLQQNGWSEGPITREALTKLSRALLKFKDLDSVQLTGLRSDRARVFPAGIAILQAIFELLDIQEMTFTDGALREGILFDLLGRFSDHDIREKTVTALSERYHSDLSQADAVTKTALHLFDQVKNNWKLQHDELRQVLRWAAQLHEIGLGISHSQFHKHGAYLLHHSDLPGFSHQHQSMLAVLVRSHRRKFPMAEFRSQPDILVQPLICLAILLRLAVHLNHSRPDEANLSAKIEVDGQQIKLSFPNGWFEDNPLTLADLETEQAYLQAYGYKLSF